MTNESDNLMPDAGNEQDQLRVLLEEISQEQPLPASGTELILLEVDPHRAHAYWNIDPTQSNPSLPLVLRVYDVTEAGSIDQASQSFDVEVHGLQGRWYLDFWRDNRTFISEIGYRQPDGNLALLARSNEVSTPVAQQEENASTGQHIDHQGNALHTDWPGDARTPPATDTEPPSTVPDATVSAGPDAKRLVAEPVTLLEPEFPLPVWSDVESARPTASAASSPEQRGPANPGETQPVDTVTAAGDAPVAFEEDNMVGDGAESGTEVGKAKTTAEYFPTAEELIASVVENHQAIQAFYASAGPEYHETEMPSETPAEPPLQEPQPGAGAAAPAHLPPLEQIVGLSSMEHMGKDVLLEVNAELHIYGRSKPNTELTIYGQIVKTRPDGSFSVRRPLPHGAVVLPLLYTKPEQ